MAVKSSFSISYYCRESKKNRQGLAPLELCININGQRLFLNLPSKFYPSDFNKKRRPSHIEEVLTQFRIKTNEVLAELMRNGLPITASTVREYMKSGGTKSHTVQDLCADFIKSLPKQQKENERKYRLTVEFMESYFGAGTELVTITQNDVNKCYERLKEKFLLSTAGGYISRIKRVFTYAKDNDWIKVNLFSNIKINKGTNSVKYLTREELDIIHNLDLSEYPRLDKVRDLLLFQASIGLAYIDLVQFNINKVQVINNAVVYSNKRQKTGVEFIAVILPMGLQILKKYDNNLPMISNQKYNAYLKEIQRLANIKTVITTHLLRKSYAHHLLNNGVRIEVVAKALGHSNTIITQKAYARTIANTVAKEIGGLIKKNIL